MKQPDDRRTIIHVAKMIKEPMMAQYELCWEVPHSMFHDPADHDMDGVADWIRHARRPSMVFKMSILEQLSKDILKESHRLVEARDILVDLMIDNMKDGEVEIANECGSAIRTIQLILNGNTPTLPKLKELTERIEHFR